MTSAKPENSAAKVAEGGSSTPPPNPGSVGSAGSGDPKRRRSANPVFRFVATFAVLMAAFSVFFFAYFTRGETFERYLELNAEVSGAILRALGAAAKVSGTAISSPAGSLQIRHGCDAIFPSALFVGAVLASPVSFRAKIPGMLIGSVVLLSINLVRIISLYYVQVYAPKLFHIMHVDVWQPAFIFLALFFWVLWAVRATRSQAVKVDATG